MVPITSANFYHFYVDETTSGSVTCKLQICYCMQIIIYIYTALINKGGDMG